MDSYNRLLDQLSNRYEMTVEQLDQSVVARRAKFFGLISKAMTARSITAPLALSAFLAAGVRHVSGLHLSDALAAVSKEAKVGHIATLGYWPLPKEASTIIASHYRQAIDLIADAEFECSISIKADLLEYDWKILLPLLQQAMLRKIRVHFDAQGLTDPTLALVEKACAMGADVSATLPSRLRRSVDDAERLLGLGIPLRIVKGQGGDPDHPKIDPRRSFLDLIKQLSGRASHIGVATHDRRVAEPALDMLMSANTPCSLEQLVSLPSLNFLAERRRIPVRTYVAYGRTGLPYAVNQLFRRPAIFWWILRDTLERLR